MSTIQLLPSHHHLLIVTEPRLGTQEFNNVVSKAKNNVTVFHVLGAGKLYVFSYRKGD